MQRTSWFLLFGALGVALTLGVAMAVGVNSPAPSLPLRAVAVIEGAPQGVGLITRRELAAEIGREAAVRGLKPAPVPGDPEFELLKKEMLYRLIRAAWFSSEARSDGVTVTAKQISTRLTPDETKTLRSLGFNRKEREEHQRWQLVEDNVLRLIEEEALGKPEEKQAAVIAGELEILREWRSRTYCAEGFLIEQCSNFPAFAREQWVPAGCYEASPKTPAEECPAPVVSNRPALPGSVNPSKPEGDRLWQGPVPEGGGEPVSPSE
jgi:hypothetical protein